MKEKSNGKALAAGWLSVLVAGATLLLIAGCNRGEANHGAPEKRIPVRTVAVEERAFAERIEVDGSIQAKTVVMVTPRVPGTIEALFVTEGDRVKVGETRLFAIDQVKLEKAVEVVQQALAVARCAKDEKKANLERVQAVLRKAEIDYERVKKLLEQERIGTRTNLEQCESDYRQAQASLKHAETLVELAGAQEQQAEASLAMARKDLRDAVVLAPFSGVVTQRYHDVGDMGAPGQAVFRVESVDRLEAAVFLPARHFGRIEVGQTRLWVSVEGEDLGSFPVTYKSPTIDPTMRVFEVECDLDQTVKGVAPGVLASVRVVLGEQRGLGVPREAVGRRNDGYVVYSVEDDRAVMHRVTPGLETDGWIRLARSELALGVQVVTEGRFLLDDGDAVEVLSD